MLARQAARGVTVERFAGFMAPYYYDTTESHRHNSEKKCDVQ